MYLQQPEVGLTYYLRDQIRLLYYHAKNRSIRIFGKPLDLEKQLQAHGIKKLPIPKIVCGINQLNWRA